MKRTMLGAMLAVSVFCGCGTKAELATASNASGFKEVKEAAIPQGFAELHISSSLKTHHPGAYASKKDVHGTPDYRLQLNIDGQPVQLQSTVRQEDSESGVRRDPEAGRGVRYQFHSRVRLKAGTHKVLASIPADGISVEREVTVPDRSSNSLVLEPAYRLVPGKQRPGFYGVTRFTEGLEDLNLVFNGAPL